MTYSQLDSLVKEQQQRIDRLEDGLRELRLILENSEKRCYLLSESRLSDLTKDIELTRLKIAEGYSVVNALLNINSKTTLVKMTTVFNGWNDVPVEEIEPFTTNDDGAFIDNAVVVKCVEEGQTPLPKSSWCWEPTMGGLDWVHYRSLYFRKNSIY